MCSGSNILDNISCEILKFILYFLGFLTVRGITCNTIWNKQFGDDGVIAWTSLQKAGYNVPFTFNSCPLVSFIYQVCFLI